VLVIGAGGAGMRAAIEASAAGAQVAVVCKSLLGKAHTVMAEGGIAAALGNVDPDDNWQVHFQDTMRGGQLINNWRMAELHARESPERVYELETYGAIFDRTPDGRILQRAFGAHTYRRLCHVGDRTGLEMIRSLQDRIVQLGIEVHMEVTLTRLLKDGDRVIGAFGYNRVDGGFVAFKAKAVIIATGGWGRIYKVTSNSWEGTGDGVGMGFDAGAEVLDPEMVQFHPTGMVWPPSVRGILVTEGVRGEGGENQLADGQRRAEDHRMRQVRREADIRNGAIEEPAVVFQRARQCRQPRRGRVQLLWRLERGENHHQVRENGEEGPNDEGRVKQDLTDTHGAPQPYS